MKKSKLQRKFVNQMRSMADVPWPARRFRYPPTERYVLTDQRCPNVLAASRRRRPGWRGVVDLLLFRRPLVLPVRCGAPLVLVPFDGRRRGHLECPRCSKAQRRWRRRSRRR